MLFLLHYMKYILKYFSLIYISSSHCFNPRCSQKQNFQVKVILNEKISHMTIYYIRNDHKEIHVF